MTPDRKMKPTASRMKLFMSRNSNYKYHIEAANSVPALIQKDGTLPSITSAPGYQGKSMVRKQTTHPKNTPSIQTETERGGGKWRSPEIGMWVRFSKEQEKFLKIKKNYKTGNVLRTGMRLF